MADPVALLDSDICIYLIEGLSDAARARVEAFEPGEVVTSAVVYAEVMRGFDPANPKAAAVDRFFEVIPIVPFDEAAARAYRQVPFQRHRFDRLIAAHALSRGLVLVTNNERDYADVPRLKVENWTAR